MAHASPPTPASKSNSRWPRRAARSVYNKAVCIMAPRSHTKNPCEAAMACLNLFLCQSAFKSPYISGIESTSSSHPYLKTQAQQCLAGRAAKNVATGGDATVIGLHRCHANGAIHGVLASRHRSPGRHHRFVPVVETGPSYPLLAIQDALGSPYGSPSGVHAVDR